MTIRVLLADDHRMFREAIEETLLHEADIEVMAGVGSGVATLEAVDRLQPDVLLLDIALPDLNGIEVARRLAEKHPRLGIVALSGYAEKTFVEEMLKAGARGYVVKSSGAQELVRAIRAVADGEMFLTPEVTRMLMRHVSPKGSGAPPPSILSAREKEVLLLLCEGAHSGEIAARLGISTATADVHRRNIKRKLRLKSMAELIRYALQEGLCPLEPGPHSRSK